MVLFLAYLGELQVDFVPLSLVVMQRLLYFVKRGWGSNSEHSNHRFSKGLKTEKYRSHTWSNWFWDGSLIIWCIALMRAW